MDERFARIPEDAERDLPAPGTRLGDLARALLRRYPIWPVVRFFLGKRVPVHGQSHWYMVGGIALFLFLVQICTGVLLMVYYRPDQPWGSVNRIMMEVPYGALIRSVHHWAANLMVFTLLVHMLSTFFMKAYRAPREATWLTGLALLALTTLFGFSGYLLPWDELSFFAVRIGVTEIADLPLVGSTIAGLVRGGDDVSLETIGRFYTLHVVVLPLLVLGLIAIHLLFVQIQGVSEPDRFRALPEEKKRYRLFLSDFLVGELPVWLFLLGLLLALAAGAPRELSPEANPVAPAPAGIKPEWYLLVPYQVLKLFPGSLEPVGKILLGVGPLLFVALPFFDRSVPADRRGALVTKAGAIGLAGFVGMTIWGLLS